MTSSSETSASRRRLVPIALSQLFGLACGIGGVRLTSRLVSPSDYGSFALFLTFAPVGMWLIHAGPIKFVQRHWAGAPDRAALLAGVARALGRKLPLLAAATAALAVSIRRENWLALWPLLFASATLLSAGAVAQAALQATRRHWADFAVSAAGSVTRSFAPPLFYFASASVGWLCAGFSLHAFVLAAAGLVFLRQYLAPPHRPAPVASIYDGPLFVALAFAGWVMAGLQRWVVTAFFGATEAGYFTLAASLATLVPSMLGTIALQYAQPTLFAAPAATAAERAQLAARVDRLSFAHAALSLAGLALLHLIAPLLVGPLIGERYRPAIALLFPAGCAMLAVVTGWFYHALLLAAKRERACGPVELGAALALAAASVGAAALGRDIFLGWLVIAPALPWLLTRPLAQRALAADAIPAPSPAR